MVESELLVECDDCDDERGDEGEFTSSCWEDVPTLGVMGDSGLGVASGVEGRNEPGILFGSATVKNSSS
jgi:hypothetical protein